MTRWLDILAHFSSNVSHIAGKHLALTDYLSRNPSALPQADDAYDVQYVINNIIPHYEFVTKYGCLSNHFNQPQSEKRTRTPLKVKQFKIRERTAIDYLRTTQISRSNSIVTKNNSIMDARTID